MRDEDLPSLSEMREYAKATWNQEFSNDEERFIDAFQHGEYHEEEPDFVALTYGLTQRQLASLYLPVCRIMISGSVNHREGSETLPILMNCFTALGKWSDGVLRSPDEILGPLAAARKVVLDEVVANKGLGRWREAMTLFEMLELGVHRRMGVHRIAIEEAYNATERQLREL